MHPSYTFPQPKSGTTVHPSTQSATDGDESLQQIPYFAAPPIDPGTITLSKLHQWLVFKRFICIDVSVLMNKMQLSLQMRI